MRVFLVGFMAAGKSRIGRRLARSLDWTFLDLDSEIAEHEGQPVADLIVERGETYFRERETAALERCAKLEHAVIATGGGVFTLERNRRLIADLGTSVWLDPPWEALCRRAQQSHKRRPLFESPDQARALYESRLESYGQADVRIRTRGTERKRDVAAAVIRRLVLAREDA
ncbi:MAG: shikimate kinase [Acidobacteria bacterium]|nr:shikimate kinase [Acidobacteriota bacterium]